MGRRPLQKGLRGRREDTILAFLPTHIDLQKHPYVCVCPLVQLLHERDGLYRLDQGDVWHHLPDLAALHVADEVELERVVPPGPLLL